MDSLRGYVWPISNGSVDLEVQSLGGMAGPASVRLGGRSVEPFAVAPWENEPESMRLPPILQRLRGEWPCVPFGITVPPLSLPPRWQPISCNLDETISNTDPHGFSSNHHWEIIGRKADSIELSIDYPTTSPIRRLRRSIVLPEGQTKIEFQLTVETRRACRLPIGLHPTFSLSTTSGASELRPGAYRGGRTYPIRFEPSSALAIDSEFLNLDHVPLEEGGHIDLRYLPLGDMREEIVQLHGVDGCFTLINHDCGYSSTLKWNSVDFPSCILWISNRGRNEYPWSNRHLALGIEPTCSFFDLNPSVAANELSLLAQKGVRMLRDFSANESWTTCYSIEFAD